VSSSLFLTESTNSLNWLKVSQMVFYKIIKLSLGTRTMPRSQLISPSAQQNRSLPLWLSFHIPPPNPVVVFLSLSLSLSLDYRSNGDPSPPQLLKRRPPLTNLHSPHSHHNPDVSSLSSDPSNLLSTTPSTLLIPSPLSPSSLTLHPSTPFRFLNRTLSFHLAINHTMLSRWKLYQPRK